MSNGSDARDCPLCSSRSGPLIWQDARLRVIQVDDPGYAAYPGYCRVIWQAHVTEMSDLSAPDRAHLWGVVDVVERALRAMLEPVKINLASLGNQVPHLHWHVIPRWRDDPHYPDPIWAAPRRPAPEAKPDAQPDAQPEPGGSQGVRAERARALAEELPRLLQNAFPW